MNARRPPSPLHNLLTGTVAKYALLAINIGIGLWMMPFTIGHLGKSDYGLWMLVASMTAYFQLLDLGYGNGLVRQIAAADSVHDVDAVNQVVSTFVVIYAGIGAVALAVVGLLAVTVLPRFPHLTPPQVATAQWVLLVMGIRVAIGFPMTVFGAVTTARQRFALNTGIAMVVSLASAAVTYVVLSRGHGLRELVPATTAVSLLSYVAYARAARFAFPPLRLSPSLFSRRHLREVTSFSLYLFVIDIAVQLGFNLDNVVLGAFLGTSAVTVYAVASRVADYQRQLCNQFNGLLFPVVVGLGARADLARLQATLLDGTRLAFGLVLGVTVSLVVFAEPLVRHWMGPEFRESLPALYALAAAGLVLVAQGPLGNILLGTGRHRLVAGAALGEALVNVALSMVFVRWWGVTGVAVGTAIPVVAVNLFVLLPAACRAVEVPVGRLLSVATVPALLSALPALAAAIALRAYVAPSSLLEVFLEGLVSGVVFVVFFARVGLSREDRARYLGYLRRMVPTSGAGAAAMDAR